MNSEKNAQTRNYGIDLFRVLSMFMIVVLHLIAAGQTVSEERGGLVLGLRMIVLCAVYCSVDCFALISGYVGYRPEKRGLKPAGYIRLWLQTAFWSTGLFAAAVLLGGTEFSAAALLKRVFPVSGDVYWYFSAYTVVFFAAPLLNRAIAAMDRRARTAALLLILGFSALATVQDAAHQDPFLLKTGYSALWLCILYFAGGILRANALDAEGAPPVSRKVLGCTAIFCALIPAAVRMYSMFPLYLYISPTSVLLAICLLKLFAGMKPGPKLQRAAAFAAPAVFGVYLIHVQPEVFEQVIRTRFQGIAELSGVLPLVVTLAAAVCIFTVCLLAEKLRLLLFRLIGLDRFAEWLGEKLQKCFDRLCTAASAFFG